jgi:anti-sigma regulatory factor (Ser/Thr protein kinase)
VGSDAELLDAALPYVHAGLRGGDLVVLSCPPSTVRLLCDALGERASTLESEPRLSLLGARAPDALTTCRNYLERAKGSGSGRLRVLADVDFGDEPAGWREGKRFESVFNRFQGDAPVSALCLYDSRRLPREVVTSAAQTHPELVHGSTWSASRRFQEPDSYVPSLPVPRSPIEDGTPLLAVDDAPALPHLRHQLGAVFAALVRDVDQREDLHLGASEIAANAFRHGVRPISAHVWSDGRRLICAITDRGTSYSDPFGGFTPAHGLDLSRGGMGLWLARKLWDHVDLLSGAHGLTVRLSTQIR